MGLTKTANVIWVALKHYHFDNTAVIQTLITQISIYETYHKNHTKRFKDLLNRIEYIVSNDRNEFSVFLEILRF